MRFMPTSKAVRKFGSGRSRVASEWAVSDVTLFIANRRGTAVNASMPFTPRRSIRLPEDAYHGGDSFVLTMCTSQRKPLFLNPTYAAAAIQATQSAAVITITQLWCAVVMPDHIHMVVTAPVGKNPLDCASSAKRLITIELRAAKYMDTVWQRRIHDRGLRTMWRPGDNAILYVLENPVRAGLATT
jgi:REP element-mobilizing transposase RayT